jgi:patatin-like phospholipase
MDAREPIAPARALAEEYVRLHGDPCGVEDADALNDDLSALYQRIHNDARNGKPRSALSISGGGIRSATFALGIIQELARLKILEKFDYLSTVSGGGYIGGWLSSYVRRRAGGIQEVAEELRREPADPTQPEVQPVRHLRDYSNYLTPKLGLLSGDTWAMAAIYLRNLLLNWLMLVPLLIALLVLPRLIIGCIRDVPAAWCGPIVAVIAALLFIAIAYLGFTRPASTTSGNPRWVETNAGFQLLALLPFFLAAMGVAFLWPQQTHQGGYTMLGSALAGAGLLGAIVYAIRFAVANRTQRREGVRHDSSIVWYTIKKIGLETIVAVASGFVAAGMLYGFFAKVFKEFPPQFKYPDILAWKDFPPTLPAITTEMYVCLAVPVVLIVFFLQSAIFVGFSSWYNEDYDREWWARASGWVLAAAFVWVAFSAIAIFGPILIYEFPRISASLGALTGLSSVLGGKSSASGGPNQKGESTKTSGINISLGLVGTIFVVIILAALSLATSEVLLRNRKEYKDVDPTMVTRLARSTYEVTSNDGTRRFSTGKYPALELERYRAFRHLWIVDNSDLAECLIIIIGCAILALAASLFIGVNRFSMHAFYRNRLIRAYLGASRNTRAPNPLSGFDPNDNIAMHKLRAESFWFRSFKDLAGFVALLEAPGSDVLAGYIAANLSARTKRLMVQHQNDELACEGLFEDMNRLIDEHDLTNRTAAPADTDPLLPLRNRKLLDETYGEFLVPCSSGRPFHIVNTTLNLVSGDELAWQERKGDAFTISPLHSGNHRLGYRYSHTYGGPGGISLGTAVAISGAAASPNMGYNSSPALSFLLTLFNVRLGWWLGNPGKAGDKTYLLRDPGVGLKPILSEMLGLTTDTHPYVYLSDGGHFENLALYEMVRRRCHCIVISDAASDLSFGFDDLGNAVRKIRIDMGVNITFEKMGIYPRSAQNPANPKYCALGTIHYDAVDPNGVNGRVLYIKPVFYGEKETRDVYNYAMTHQTFPHETTADQFFSESQFESYRALGELTVQEIAAFMNDREQTPCAFLDAASDYLKHNATPSS